MNSSEWNEVKLGEVADILSGYAFKSKDFIEEGIPVVKIKNIVPPNVTLDDTQFVSNELADEKKRYELKYNDVLISLTGSNVNQLASAVGKVGRVRFTDKRLLLNQRVGKFEILDETKYNLDFLYYLVSTDEMRYKLASNASGAANQANISPSLVKEIKLPCPPISVQRNIATTLSCLDEKVENNNRIKKNLEEIAKAIFKSWFVDFEPFIGGEFEDSELGRIPKGWRVIEIGQVIEEIKDRVKDLELPVLSAVKTGNLILSEEYFTKQVFSKNISKYIVVKPFEFAYNPARINIGSIGINEFEHCGCVSPIYVAFRCDPMYKWYFSRIFKTERFNTEVNSRASGSVRQTLNYNEFSKIKIIYPTRDIVSRYNLIFESFYKTQNEMNIEINTLTEIRNSILPKLISGEIRIPIEEVQ